MYTQQVMQVFAILPAAGLGTRMAASQPKQFLELRGVPILIHSLRAFAAVERITGIFVAVRRNEMERVEAQIESQIAEHAHEYGLAGRVRVVEGGEAPDVRLIGRVPERARSGRRSADAAMVRGYRRRPDPPAMGARRLIRCERIGAVARITLDQPERGNVVDAAMAMALLDTAAACDRDPSIRCVLLTGAGKLFCGGGDAHAFAATGADAPRIVAKLTGIYHAAISRLARMDKPLITAINGGAAGAGLGLAILGDIVLASTKAHFSFGYSGIGFSPDGGTSWLLPRLIGLRRAQDMVLTNRRVGAEEAAAMGLVTRVVEHERLADEALAVATGLAAGPTRALGRTRSLLLGSFDTSFETHLEHEARAIATSSADPEGREGIAAFLAKRPPDFAVD